jgi:hypothetical protein
MAYILVRLVEYLDQLQRLPMQLVSYTTTSPLLVGKGMVETVRKTNINNMMVVVMIIK